MGDRIGRAALTLDIHTRGGEVPAGVPQRAGKAMVATESWPPNIKRAQENLRGKGVVVVADEDQPPLPFAAGTFDLVTCRHPAAAEREAIIERAALACRDWMSAACPARAYSSSSAWPTMPRP
jgi:hypothetical protein